jgi:hypothetical protein
LPKRDKPERFSLPTQDELRLFGVNLRKTYPIPQSEGFEDLLWRIERMEDWQKPK